MEGSWAWFEGGGQWPDFFKQINHSRELEQNFGESVFPRGELLAFCLEVVGGEGEIVEKLLRKRLKI